MTNPSISVVVPVYRVEPYLQECIDSILAQSFSDFELILVNDGSPDSCGAICDQNAARDSRIRVHHQKNQGVTRARAKGDITQKKAAASTATPAELPQETVDHIPEDTVDDTVEEE